MSDWIKWNGGECPVAAGTRVEVKYRDDEIAEDCDPDLSNWIHYGEQGDIIAYRVVEEAAQSSGMFWDDHQHNIVFVQDEEPIVEIGTMPGKLTPVPEYTGGSSSYYKVNVGNPVSGGIPYVVECQDVIEALDMSFSEGNIFKAIWRICAAKKGKAKKGYEDSVYDLEKIIFFAQRELQIEKMKRGK